MLIGQRKRDVVVARRRNRIGSERNGGRGQGGDSRATEADATATLDEHRWRICPQGCAHPLTASIQRRAGNRPTVHKIPIDNLFTSAPSRSTTCPRPQSVPWNRYPSLEDFLGVHRPRYSRTKREGRQSFWRSFFFLFFFFFFWEGLSRTGWVLSVAGYWRERCSVTRVWVQIWIWIWIFQGKLFIKNYLDGISGRRGMIG